MDICNYVHFYMITIKKNENWEATDDSGLLPSSFLWFISGFSTHAFIFLYLHITT